MYQPMSKFEKKFGKYAIRNISLILILCYACGYIIELIGNGAFLSYLTLDPYAIIHGQVWRLITWIIVPPSSFDFFTLLMLYVYYSLGTSLERTWGTYRLNVYLIQGMLFTIAGAFALMAVSYLWMPGAIAAYGGASSYFSLVAQLFSTYYVNMSIFLAFAATFPDMQMLLFFVIPIKVKYLGIIYAALLVYQFIAGGIYTRFVIGASLLNFVVFWFTGRNHIHLSPKQMKRRQEFKREVKKNSGITRHKCAICGRTEEDDPTLEFRFCTKCAGNYEYCQEHLYTHTHIK